MAASGPRNFGQTPKKIVFRRLKALKGCFSCGATQLGHLRLLQNAALEVDYRVLVKQSLLIDLPQRVDVRVCQKCIVKMEKVSNSLVIFNCHFLGVS
jgi:hypothetical protein